MKKGTKRRTMHDSESSNKPTEENQSEELAVNRRHKRVKVSIPKPEPEFFAEKQKRNLEDLWHQVFLVGTEWNQLDMVYKNTWDFSNLENAFEEGGELHNRRNVYLFGCTEPQLVSFQGQLKPIMVPVVVAIVSPFPPSDKIGITSVQRAREEIVNMKQMKMDWVPYIPLEKRGSQVERIGDCQIFTLRCSQRRAGLKHLKIEQSMKFEYSLPYFYNPLEEDDELEKNTVVDILFEADGKPVVGAFDWDEDNIDKFADMFIEYGELVEDQKEAFKDFVEKKIREAKEANRETKEVRERAVDEMSEETRAGFENMRFYKFYPVSTPNTSDVCKSPFINRYYGKAHMVF